MRTQFVLTLQFRHRPSSFLINAHLVPEEDMKNHLYFLLLSAVFIHLSMCDDKEDASGLTPDAPSETPGSEHQTIDSLTMDTRTKAHKFRSDIIKNPNITVEALKDLSERLSREEIDIVQFTLDDWKFKGFFTDEELKVEASLIQFILNKAITAKTTSAVKKTSPKVPAPPQKDPPQKDLTPPQKDLTPAHKDLAPPQKDLTPANKDLAPPQKDLTPANKDLAPPQKDLTPPQKDPTPPQKDLTPPQKESQVPLPTPKETPPPSKPVPIAAATDDMHLACNAIKECSQLWISALQMFKEAHLDKDEGEFVQYLVDLMEQEDFTVDGLQNVLKTLIGTSNYDANSVSDKPDGVTTVSTSATESAPKVPEQPNGDENRSENEDDHQKNMFSGFGAWHFITIFIIISVAVVVGYVCMHNRKKLREGVGSYLADANRSRKRARDYRPLKMRA